VLGDYVYQANYRAGINVLKIDDASNAQFEERGFFYLYPSSDSADFNGAWSNYPFFPSGTIIMSGIEQGLFVVKFTGHDESSLSPTPNPTTATNAPTPSPTPAATTTCSSYFKNECNGEESCFWYRGKCRECSAISDRGYKRKICERYDCTWDVVDKICE
jgi:hypothetical protein